LAVLDTWYPEHGHADALRQQFVILDDETVTRVDLVVAIGVDVVDAQQSCAEAMVCDRVQYPVREIFLEHVLFVTVAVLLAMRDQLQLVLPGKLRPLDLLLLEVEPDGRQVAGGLLPAVPAARAQLQVELYLLAGCIGISKGTFQVL